MDTLKQEERSHQTVITEIIRDRRTGRLMVHDLDSICMGNSKANEMNSPADGKTMLLVAEVNSPGVYCSLVADDPGRDDYSCFFFRLAEDGTMTQIPIEAVTDYARLTGPENE